MFVPCQVQSCLWIQLSQWKVSESEQAAILSNPPWSWRRRGLALRKPRTSEERRKRLLASWTGALPPRRSNSSAAADGRTWSLRRERWWTFLPWAPLIGLPWPARRPLLRWISLRLEHQLLTLPLQACSQKQTSFQMSCRPRPSSMVKICVNVSQYAKKAYKLFFFFLSVPIFLVRLNIT